MSQIKENSLNEEMAQTALHYLRLVTSKLTGDSKLVQIQNLVFQIANIFGLQTALDGKSELVPGSTSEIPIFDVLGQIISSDFKVGGFTDETTMDACTQQGLYTASGVVSVPVVGDVQFVLVVTGHRLMFTTLGLWHSTYGTGWSVPRYVGGSSDNIEVTYLQAVDLVANNNLSPGAKYKITGVGQDLGIIVSAASYNTFETDGVRIGLRPAYFGVGAYGDYTFGGLWRSGMAAPTIDTYYLHYSRVYKSLTGAVGTSADYALDATNWLLVDPETGIGDFYAVEIFSCSYRLVSSLPLVFTTGYVYKQKDSRGNTFGHDVEPADGFRVEWNDWGNQYIYGNTLKSCRNNIASAASPIHDNTGKGDIHDLDNCDLHDNILPNSDNNIRYCINSEITDNILGANADIQYLTTGSSVTFNTINGDVKGDSAAYCDMLLRYSEVGYGAMIKDFISAAITDSKIYGIIDGNKTTSEITLQLCRIESNGTSAVLENNVSASFTNTIIESGCTINANTSLILDGCKIKQGCTMTTNDDVALANCTMEPGAVYSNKDMNGYYLSNRVIKTSDTATVSYASQSILDETQGNICSCIMIGAGTFDIVTGSSYTSPTNVVACTAAIIRNNGISITGSSITNLIVEIIYPGWYKVLAVGSATASVKCTLDNVLFAGPAGSETEREWIHSRKTYVTTGDYLNNSRTGHVYLNAGDRLSLRYKHNVGSTVTLTLDEITINIDYEH